MGLAPQWPSAHTSTHGWGGGAWLITGSWWGGDLTTLAGLYGPLLTDHTGKCVPRAHDFQFSTKKGSWEEVARRPETLACASVNSILSVLPSTLPLIHSLSHPSIQVSAHLSIHSFFYLATYQFTLAPIHPTTLHLSFHHSTSPSI